MDQQKQGVAPQESANLARDDTPRSLIYTERGIRTAADFANVMSALMGDLIAGRVTPQVGNATCNVGGKLLRIVEMQHKYGTSGGEGQQAKTLLLADVPIAERKAA
jgi:hypothetical protein